MNRRQRRSLVARIRAVGGIVVACVQTKGGAGKSTLAWNLAWEYAQRGARVLLINADMQMTVVDAMAVRAMSGYAETITVITYPHDSLWEDLPRLRGDADVIVIDGQGRNERITRAVLTAAVLDRHGVALVPVKAQPPDVWASKRDMAPIVAAARELVPWRARIRTVLTQYDPREQITRAAIALLAQPPVLAPPSDNDVQIRAAFGKAIASGRAVCEYEPGGAAAAEIAALATEAAELALSETEPKTTQENQQ